MGNLRISELATRTGIPATTLRYYDDAGLLSADRTPSGYRMYDDGAVERLGFISSGKLLGLSLDEIRDLLALQDSGVCAHVRARLAALVDQRIEEADRRLAEVSAFRGRLAQTHHELKEPAPAGACGPDCGCLTSTGPAPGPVPVTIESPPVPVACTLDGAIMGDRIEEWHDLLARATLREATDGGLRVTFPVGPELAAEVSRLAAAEVACCAFYEFTVELTPRSVVLTVRAPSEAADLVAELFGVPA